MVVEMLQVLAVNGSSPYKTLKEFVDGAKVNPASSHLARLGSLNRLRAKC